MIEAVLNKIRNILTSPTEELGRMTRFAIYQLKLWVLCRKLLIRNRYGQQAAALSYHTIFGVIPLAIIMLLIFQSFPSHQGISEQVRQFMYDRLELSQFQYPSPDGSGETILLTDYIDKLLGNFFNRSSKGSVTIVSLLVVAWAAIGLLSTIERTFNNIWNVRHGRSLIARIFSYWTPLTLGPLLLGAAMFLTANPLVRRWHDAAVVSWTAPILPYLINVAALFVLYWSIPNTKVKVSSALWAAAVAALIWTLVKALMHTYVTKFIPYNQLYGVLGLIPLTILWISITWKIVLFGVQLSYTTQNFEQLDEAELRSSGGGDNYFMVNDEIVIDIVNEISAAFEAGEKPMTIESLCKKLNIPADFAEAILDHLVSENIIYITSEPSDGYVPATSAANFSIGTILSAISSKKLGYSEASSRENKLLKEAISKSKEYLANYTLADLQRQKETQGYESRDD